MSKACSVDKKWILIEQIKQARTSVIHDKSKGKMAEIDVQYIYEGRKQF
jgi:hypothetical protein